FVCRIGKFFASPERACRDDHKAATTQFASCPTCSCLMCAEATSVYGTHAPASCLTFECALPPCTRDASGHAGAQSLRTRRAYPGPVREVSTITDDRKWFLCHEDCCPCGVPSVLRPSRMARP